MDEAQHKLQNELDININIPFTNEKMVEIYTKVNESKSCTINYLALACNFDCDHLRKRVFNIRKKCKKLRGEVLKGFLQQSFILSERSETAKPSTSSLLGNIIEETKLGTLETIIKNLKTDNTKLKTTNETLKKEIDILKKHRRMVVRQNKRLALLLKKKERCITLCMPSSDFLH